MTDLNQHLHERLAGSATTSGLVNLRDLGGLPTIDGTRTRHGVLYRSDAPYPDDEDPATVDVWPPAAVLDLRAQAERDAVGHEWAEGSVLHHWPLYDAAAPISRDAPDLVELYRNILEAVPHRVAAVVGVAAQAEAPLLVHCAAGKDRTGITVAALLLAADVDPDAVIADYLATAANMTSLRNRWTVKGKEVTIAEEWLLTPQEAIEFVLDRFLSAPGGVTGWLREHGAEQSDIDRWRVQIRE
ncbi:hypothetical protein GCM10022261_03210 [Brevibacterium daeguense]|uniref:Protein tyrosine/serine phosphatase n=1 Tax=Brevibacterium daeguense TaxID=909936 RepID=A0ABP8EFQ3_9MICO|nr:tyrosine-protein phosphatase [Brevibacterium daeguense]